jgi:hypothetical protein
MIHNVRGFVMLRINAINRQYISFGGVSQSAIKAIVDCIARSNKPTQQVRMYQISPNSTLYSYRKGFQALS